MYYIGRSAEVLYGSHFSADTGGVPYRGVAPRVPAAGASVKEPGADRHGHGADVDFQLQILQPAGVRAPAGCPNQFW